MFFDDDSLSFINFSFLSQAINDKGNKTELGCLYEATEMGTKLITLEDGSQMKYLNDEDEVILEAWCEDRSGNLILGFGECRGKLLPALKN
jgi:fumarylacetoacetase